MGLKINDTNKYNLTLDVNIDYNNKKITTSVRFWDKVKHKIDEYEYDIFSQALDKYDEFEKIIESEEN